MNDTKKLATFALAIVTATVGSLGWFSGQISAAINKHGEHPHAPTAAALAAGVETDTEHAKQLAKLEDMPDDIAAIRARIDLVVLGHVEDSQRTPHRRARLKARAAKVRSDAKKRGASGDPLAGMEGL